MTTKMISQVNATAKLSAELAKQTLSSKLRHKSLRLALIRLCFVLACATGLSSSAEQTIYGLDEELLSGGRADQQSLSNTPGHYEFEVAPKMEPPTVRRPPYLQSTQLCPGSGECPRDATR